MTMFGQKTLLSYFTLCLFCIQGLSSGLLKLDAQGCLSTQNLSIPSRETLKLKGSKLENTLETKVGQLLIF